MDERTESRVAGVTGIVLAGGRSTRFVGGDKALAVVEGEPILARVVGALADATESVVVNCRADQRDGFADLLEGVGVPVRFAVDERPDEGPLVGLGRALRAVETPRVIVVACDLPFLDSSMLSTLAVLVADDPADDATATVEESSRREVDVVPDAAVPVGPDGYRKPTCAAYRTVPLGRAVSETLESGTRQLRAALEPLDVQAVDADDLGVSPRALLDVDSRADLDALEDR